MPGNPTFVVITFKVNRGQIVPGGKDVAPSASAAMKRAEIQSARMIGAAALQIVADEDTGEVEKAELLATFGRVPNDLLDKVRGG